MSIESPELRKSKVEPFCFDYPVPESWLDTKEKEKSERVEKSGDNDLGDCWDENEKLPYSNVLVPSSSFSTIYRRDVIDEIESFFSKQKKGDKLPLAPTKFALSGDAGIGKSYAALQFAFEQLDFRRVKSMLRISCESEFSILAGFSACAKELGFPSVRSEDHVYNTYLIREWLMDTLVPWLIIFDDVEDASLVEKYLPDFASFGQVVITMRSYKIANYLCEGELTLTRWDFDLIRQIFFRQLWDMNGNHDEDVALAAQELCRCLQDPAAMLLEGGLMSKNSWSIKDVFKKSKDHSRYMSKAIWDITFCTLSERERAILGLSTFLPQEYITEFKEFMDPKERQERFGNAVALTFAAYPGGIHGDDDFEDYKYVANESRWSECFTHLPTVMRLRDYFYEENKADPEFSAPSLFCRLLNLTLRYFSETNAYDDLLSLAEDNKVALSTIKSLPHEARVSIEGDLALYKGQALVRTGRVEEGVQQLKLAQNLFFAAEPCRFADAAWCAERLAEAMLSISSFTKAMQHYEQARSWRIQEQIDTNNEESLNEFPLSFEWSRQICLFELARGDDAKQMEVIWDLGSYIASKPLSGHSKHIQRNIMS
ncbi:NB-ARC and TPR domain protein [Penicillium herquei]|nr:NB-ARC and TPR domain protein [Penicillium herquei]